MLSVPRGSRDSAAYSVVVLPDPVGPGDEHDAVRLADQPVHGGQRRLAHSQRGEIELRRVLVEEPQHDALARAGRQRRHADVDLLVAQLQRESPVLRQALFGDVEVRHDLHPRHQGCVQRPRRLQHVAQHTVDPEAHDRAPLVGLEVDVGRALAQRLQQQRVDHPDHRRLGAAVQQIVGRRQILQQAREVGIARQIVGHLGDARRDRVVGTRELRREAIGVDGACGERPLQDALQLGDAFDRRVLARQHDDRAALLSLREHAVRPGERVRDLLRERAAGGSGCSRRGGHRAGGGGGGLPLRVGAGSGGTQ